MSIFSFFVHPRSVLHLVFPIIIVNKFFVFFVSIFSKRILGRPS